MALVEAIHPTDVADVMVVFTAALPVVDATNDMEKSSAAAFAAGEDTTEKNPAVSADAATIAMRCLIVFLDIFFLSLVELGNFPISARRSFDPLIPSSLAHTCNANEAGNLFIQWVLTHHLFALVLVALESQSQVVLRKVAYDLHTQ